MCEVEAVAEDNVYSLLWYLCSRYVVLLQR